jgi:SAM-dependent methyltransferase
MDPAAMKPFGRALADYFNGDTAAEFCIYRDDGRPSRLPAAIFFREATDINIDKVALDNCHGYVLDVGAGMGIHSLYLKDNGFTVCSVDISPEACEIMRKRELEGVRCVDITGLKAGPFDTVLVLGRGIGMVETVDGLDYFLKCIRGLVKKDGRILLNSCDVAWSTAPEDLSYHEINRQAGRYIVEVRMYFEYKGERGPLHGWLHVDSVTLAQHAAEAGWQCEVLLEEEDSNYLAVLTINN